MDIKKRLETIIENDKKLNPKYICEVIKSDFFYLINNYFDVKFKDIDLNFDVKSGNYEITINCQADRIKLMKSLPD